MVAIVEYSWDIKRQDASCILCITHIHVQYHAMILTDACQNMRQADVECCKVDGTHRQWWL